VDDNRSSVSGLVRQFGRRFVLRRHVDHSGVSGTGVVAAGVQFGDDQVVLKWLARISSVGIYPSVAAVEKIHGHGGDTTIEWVDP
jgi:hypothetical protein